jgi:hypothetical protein
MGGVFPFGLSGIHSSFHLSLWAKFAVESGRLFARFPPAWKYSTTIFWITNCLWMLTYGGFFAAKRRPGQPPSYFTRNSREKLADPFYASSECRDASIACRVYPRDELNWDGHVWVARTGSGAGGCKHRIGCGNLSLQEKSVAAECTSNR